VPAVAVFIVVLFLTLGQTHLSETGRKLIFALIYSALIGIPSAMLLNWLGHRYSARLGRWVFVLQTLLLVVTGTVGSLAAAIVLAATGMIGNNYWSEFRYSLPFALVITLVTGMGATTYFTLYYRLQASTLALRTREVERERAYKLLAEARLSSLESRVQPHFLFNTLNSIAALIPMDPKRAEDTVGKLASLLRFSLGEHAGGLVSLEQELRVVRDYLEIESTRFGSRLKYAVDVPAELLGTRVPPLAVQVLVENAVKHVAAQRSEGAEIHVTGTRLGHAVRLEVTDDGPGFRLDAITPEHGLGNLVGRMDLLFGERGKLDVARRDGRTLVSLEFPAES
jgi:sensor histidine kinase YesM